MNWKNMGIAIGMAVLLSVVWMLLINGVVWLWEAV